MQVDHCAVVLARCASKAWRPIEKITGSCRPCMAACMRCSRRPASTPHSPQPHTHKRIAWSISALRSLHLYLIELSSASDSNWSSIDPSLIALPVVPDVSFNLCLITNDGAERSIMHAWNPSVWLASIVACQIASFGCLADRLQCSRPCIPSRSLYLLCTCLLASAVRSLLHACMERSIDTNPSIHASIHTIHPASSSHTPISIVRRPAMHPETNTVERARDQTWIDGQGQNKLYHGSMRGWMDIWRAGGRSIHGCWAGLSS